MKKNLILSAEAAVQVLSMLVLYPLLIAMAIRAKVRNRYGFDCYTKVCGIAIFPGFGKWWLPMIWLNWHYCV